MALSRDLETMGCYASLRSFMMSRLLRMLKLCGMNADRFSVMGQKPHRAEIIVKRLKHGPVWRLASLELKHWPSDFKTRAQNAGAVLFRALEDGARRQESGIMNTLGNKLSPVCLQCWINRPTKSSRSNKQWELNGSTL